MQQPFQRRSSASIAIESATKTGLAGPVSLRCVRLRIEAFGAGGCRIADRCLRASGPMCVPGPCRLLPSQCESRTTMPSFIINTGPLDFIRPASLSASSSPPRSRNEIALGPRNLQRRHRHHEQCFSKPSRRRLTTIKLARACAGRSIRTGTRQRTRPPKNARKTKEIDPPCPSSTSIPTPTHFVHHHQPAQQPAAGRGLQ